MPSIFPIDTNIITDKEAKRILSAADQGKIDSLWSSSNIGSSAPNAYFDYFFSGQDIQVYIDGTEDYENFLPIHSFSFNITQQKTPVYGFWDYCVDQETEALTRRGWVNGFDLREDDIVLSMCPKTQELKWSSIKSIYRSEGKKRMHRVTGANIDALVTPGHKFALATGALVPVEKIRMKDRIVCMGTELRTTSSIYSDAFIEIVGWFVTEGHIRSDVEAIEISQSAKVNKDKLDRIRLALSECKVEWTERMKASSQVVQLYIGVKNPIVQELKKVAPNKVLTMDFITSLSTEQRRLLIETMIDGDGWRHSGRRFYGQKDQDHLDAFMALCAFSGIGTTLTVASDEYKNVILKKNRISEGYGLDFHGGKGSLRNGGEGHTPTYDYDGLVWCPETEYGTFVCRRNGKVYVTGNTYSAVMRGTRIIQGQFVVITRSPDYMRTILEKAATARASKGRQYSYFRDLTEDDKNIEKYWGKNIDPAIASAGKNIFSVHPPFSFVIVYGIQNISFNPLEPSGDSSFVYDRYDSDSPLMLDTNERLVESDPLDQANRIIIDGCELTSMQTNYDSSGMIVAESYSFFGRDMIIPARG